MSVLTSRAAKRRSLLDEARGGELEERGDSIGATYVANACCSICRGEKGRGVACQSILMAGEDYVSVRQYESLDGDY